MPNLKSKHSHFHWVHLIAVFILSGYVVLSKVNLVSGLTKDLLIVSFLQLYLFGAFFACLFLFLFSHEKFFPFAREMEKKEEKSEREFLKKYIHHGKILGTFLIGTFGGPLFSSLTARLLLNNYPLKYVIIILANIPSTLLTVALAKGLLHFYV